MEKNYFLQHFFMKSVLYKNIFAKKLVGISSNFFFHDKTCKYFLQKTIQNKLVGNMSFSSGTLVTYVSL